MQDSLCKDPFHYHPENHKVSMLQSIAHKTVVSQRHSFFYFLAPSLCLCSLLAWRLDLVLLTHSIVRRSRPNQDQLFAGFLLRSTELLLYPPCIIYSNISMNKHKVLCFTFFVSCYSFQLPAFHNKVPYSMVLPTNVVLCFIMFLIV